MKFLLRVIEKLKNKLIRLALSFNNYFIGWKIWDKLVSEALFHGFKKVFFFLISKYRLGLIDCSFYKVFLQCGFFLNKNFKVISEHWISIMVTMRFVVSSKEMHQFVFVVILYTIAARAFKSVCVLPVLAFSGYIFIYFCMLLLP